MNDAPKKEDLLEVARACFHDPVLFLKTFLPDLFPGEFSKLHRGALAVLTGKSEFLTKYGDLEWILKNFTYRVGEEERSLFQWSGKGALDLIFRPYVEIMFPRGFGKTTLAGIGVNIYDICYQRVKFGCYLSETGAHADMQLDNIKRELAENERIIQIFGDLRPKIRDDEKWSAKIFQTRTGVSYVSRGRGAQVRGLNIRGQRPQKLIVDDVEDKESVETELQREKTRRWFYGDVKPALPTVGPKGQIIVLGTLLHGQALMETLAQDPEWSVVRLAVKDKDEEWTWPEAYDGKRDESERRSYTLAGELSTFYLEFYNEDRPDSTRIFRKEFMQYRPSTDLVAVATYNDPAISKKRKACHCVTISAGIDNKGHISVLDVWGKQGPSMSEITDEYFRQQRTYSSRFNGVESNAFQAALIEVLRSEMFKRKQYFEIIPVPHKKSKTERIKGGLQGRFASGYISFVRPFPELEQQLLDFRTDIEGPDDYADALAGVVELLDPVAGLAAGEGTEDKYPDVEEEIGGSYLVEGI